MIFNPLFVWLLSKLYKRKHLTIPRIMRISKSNFGGLEMESFDFEKYWLKKLEKALIKYTDLATTKEILSGSERLSDESNNLDVIKWTQSAMNIISEQVDISIQQEIMLSCACSYPVEKLQQYKKHYAEFGDVNAILSKLRDEFRDFLKNEIKLDDEDIQYILGKGWGLAGVRKGNSIIATKIPKSGFLKQYLQESDPVKKRQFYCHCPRIRQVLESEEVIPDIYCYCGAGFYRGIWEEILQKPVKIKLLKSVLKGDDVCQVEIILPREKAVKN